MLPSEWTRHFLTPDGPGVEPDHAKHLVQARLERRVCLEVVHPHWHVRVHIREERVCHLLPQLLYLLPLTRPCMPFGLRYTTLGRCASSRTCVQ
jgi:hypothetical protein